jgi:Domain of unknown function (DUF5655)
VDTGPTDAGMWACPDCGRTFAAARQVHTCRPLGRVDDHFTRSAPEVRATFDRIVEAVSALGPVEVLAERTRIALHVRMSFAALTPRRRWLDGHLVLARTVPSPRFRRIETYSPRNVLHAFRLTSPAEVDDEFRGWLAEAYRVGQQRHRR